MRPNVTEMGGRWVNTSKKLKYFFFLNFIYLFLDTGEERKRGRETSVYGCFSRIPYWGHGLQPRHVPQLGIEPATLWFTGQHSTTEPHQPSKLKYFL